MPGTRFGPRAILEASRQVEFYDEELDLEPFRIGIATLGEVEVDPADPQAGLERLEGITASLADAGIIPFTLGGSTRSPSPRSGAETALPRALRSAARRHFDLREQYQGRS